MMRGALGDRPQTANEGQYYYVGDHGHLYQFTGGVWELQGLPAGQSGEHPDLAAHTTLGLAAAHSHPYASDSHSHTHNHDGVYEVVHSHPYAATSHSHVDGDLPAGIARDAEVAAAYSPLGHSHAGGSIATLKKTANQTINGTAFQNVTDLTFPVSANTDYAFRFYLVFQSAQTATGFRFGVNGPAGATVDYVLRYQTVANSATAGVATFLDMHNVGYDQMTVTSATITANVDLYATIEGRILVTGTAGTFAVRAASEAANNDLSIRKGSWGMYW